ncbi:hypothetical protein CSIM01_12924 [Colletotrichum simmondsii]|uniref:RING-type domain-containing protein n=1 Tax=Colletotrichum simmondsii TaxID=703756 RepID=A0A135TKD3_9PEZI|nr:hypothetical protein CSIM01_12924 [Colletotrichum simmondsii]
MDEAMDYAYHHPEQPQGQAQNPYAQQRPRCPYFLNREGQQQLPGMPQHRSTMHYDPVHSSANYPNWQPQVPPIPGPYHWQHQPHMMNHRGHPAPQHRPSNSASEAPYYNHVPVPNFGNVAGGYSGAPPIEMVGPPTMQLSFPHTQLPPVRFNLATALPAGHPAQGQPFYTSSERNFGGQNAAPRHNTFNTTSHSVNTSTPPVAQTSSEHLVAAPNPPQIETSDSTGGTNQAPSSGTSIQFGSAPPSSTLHRSTATFPNPPHDVHQPNSGEWGLPAPDNLYANDARNITGASSSGASSSSSSLGSHHHPERRRVPAIRRASRRQSPLSDSDVDSDRSALEQVIALAGNPTQMARHIMTLEEDHVRAAQFMRGSVTTKYVASSSAIQSLQSVPITELSESERTCVICYNEFGVETPEGVKEAPLRLPKCKHVFGDHCIKKWFEESDSCPYCRDKVPHEARITSTHPNFDRYYRNRGHVNLGGLAGYAGYMRDRDASLAQDDSNRSQGSGSSHGERRSPPTDSGESRRRIRPRTGIQGSGSPTFSSSRPRPVSSTYESNRRAHAAIPALLPPRAAFAPNGSSRTNHGATSQVSFSGSSMHQHHHQATGFAGLGETGSASTQGVPITARHPNGAAPTALGVPEGLHGNGYLNPANRTSLPAVLPGPWIGDLTAPDESHRRMMGGENGVSLQANPWVRE